MRRSPKVSSNLADFPYIQNDWAVQTLLTDIELLNVIWISFDEDDPHSQKNLQQRLDRILGLFEQGTQLGIPDDIRRTTTKVLLEIIRRCRKNNSNISAYSLRLLGKFIDRDTDDTEIEIFAIELGGLDLILDMLLHERRVAVYKNVASLVAKAVSRSPRFRLLLLEASTVAKVDIGSFILRLLRDPLLETSEVETLEILQAFLYTSSYLPSAEQCRTMIAEMVNLLGNNELSLLHSLEAVLASIELMMNKGLVDDPKTEQILSDLKALVFPSVLPPDTSPRSRLTIFEMVMLRFPRVFKTFIRMGVLDVLSDAFRAGGDEGSRASFLFVSLISSDLGMVDRTIAHQTLLGLAIKFCCHDSAFDFTSLFQFGHPMTSILQRVIPRYMQTAFGTKPLLQFFLGGCMDLDGVGGVEYMFDVMQRASLPIWLKEMRDMPVEEVQGRIRDPNDYALRMMIRLPQGYEECIFNLMWLALAIGLQDPRDKNGKPMDVFEGIYPNPKAKARIMGLRVAIFMLTARPKTSGSCWLSADLRRRVVMAMSEPIQ